MSVKLMDELQGKKNFKVLFMAVINQRFSFASHIFLLPRELKFPAKNFQKSNKMKTAKKMLLLSNIDMENALKFSRNKKFTFFFTMEIAIIKWHQIN